MSKIRQTIARKLFTIISLRLFKIWPTLSFIISIYTSVTTFYIMRTNVFVRKYLTCAIDTGFFSIWVFFHNHSWITRLHGKGEGIFLTPHYHFHSLHRHLDITRAITAERSLLHIAAGLKPGTFGFGAQVPNH